MFVPQQSFFALEISFVQTSSSLQSIPSVHVEYNNGRVLKNKMSDESGLCKVDTYKEMKPRGGVVAHSN